MNQRTLGVVVVATTVLMACGGDGTRGDDETHEPDTGPGGSETSDAGDASGCKAGARRCEGSTLQVCSTASEWLDGVTCDFACDEGRCSGVCVPGSRRCEGSTPQSCDASGAWVDGSPCEFACNDGNCSGECAAGTKQCDGATPQTCSTAGAWENGTACDYICRAGECAGACRPGSTRCVSPTEVETCDESAAWVRSSCPIACQGDACGCEPRYAGDGTSCRPVDYCSASAGGCSPNATCSQTGTTPTCTCKDGFTGDGLSCSAPPTAVIDEGFEDASLLTEWLTKNSSDPTGTWLGWYMLGENLPFPAQNGPPLSYAYTSFPNTANKGTLSVWLELPLVTFGAQSSLSFYTRTRGEPHPDRLEVRLCTALPCELPEGSASVVGYEKLLLTINSDLTTTGYPTTWTEYTVTDLPRSGQGRLAFRYWVTDGGKEGTNSDFVGVDTVVVRAGAPAYEVGGTVSGLTSGTFSVWLNGLVEQQVSASGGFKFPAYLDAGTPYSVSILAQPAGHSCKLTNAAGTIGSAAVTNVEVACVAH